MVSDRGAFLCQFNYALLKDLTVFLSSVSSESSALGSRPRFWPMLPSITRSSCLNRKSSLFLARPRKQISTLLYLSTSTTSAAQVIHWFGVARLQPRECKPQSNAESQEFSLVAPAGAPSHTGRILMSKSGNLVCKVVGLKALTLFHP